MDDERLPHRLEAFSDVVLGFSLAQLGLNLTLPQHDVNQIFLKPYGLIAFAVTFAVVSILWYQHHRLFAHYFKPHTLTVVLNFITLGFAVLLVYSLQVYVRFATTSERNAAALFYIGTLAATYTLLGILFAIGVKDHKSELDATTRLKGTRSATRLIVFGIGSVVGVSVCAAFGLPMIYGVWLVIPTMILLRLVWRVQDARRVRAGAS